ncbi:recombinase family protein [Klebsiella pneumoniae]|uniref:recombinase family protein n=1 Tax=Klebsiella pneumoniae complex TaxID=3390273 RepID=UPI000DE614A2|nr:MULTISPECIES: recombinase family protein [Klebsiella]HDU5628695.1 recombinase family protein [Klebsiella pneumoniae subsp. pneumoniae]MBZ7533121.1 recombinase family protein [Klebsiella variicola]UMV13473.1 recombinase family protein [Klebsiella pneumoniae]WPI38212.1 recombinase family protein [Klebsiella pneumoniae]WPI44415.1 recombinase family protein [Klebsiella pneumoniae]
MPKAISYIRFSTKIQSVGDSTKRQSKYINDWLKRNPDYYLDETLRFQDLGISGFSGANAKSGAFGEFLAAVESGYIEAGSVLLVESLDRVSRQDIDTAGEQLRKILRSGVEVVTLVDNEWYTKESLKDSLSMIKAMLVMERAHEESAMKSTRLRSVWAAKRERAAKGEIMSKRCAAWLKVSEDRSRFEFIPENVKAVQRVFQLRLEGLSHVKIAKQMNDEGFSTLNQFKSVTGGWSQSSVTELLSNRSVIGFKVPSKSMAVKGVSEIPNYYPSIITDEQFYAVQQLKQGSGRKPSSDLPLLTNLFKGVLRCSECGFIVVVAGVSAKRSGIYKCSMKSEGRCNSVGFSRLQTDRALVQGLLYNANRLFLNRDNGSAIGALQGELEQLQKQRERLIKLAMLADDTESMAKDLKALNSQIKDAEKAVSEVHQREQSSQLETISHLDLTVKKDRIEAQIIIKRIVKEIRLNTAEKKCDVLLHNGLRLLNFPLDMVVDGAQWLEILPLIDGDEFDFEGFSTKPRHLAFEEAPEWVKELEFNSKIQ